MIVKVGDKVRLVNTKMIGYVADYINDKMILIKVDDDDIPVFLEDLEFVGEEIIIPQRKISYSREIRNLSPYDELNRGVFVAFLPIRDKNDAIQEFQLYLINNSHFQQLIDFTFRLKNRDVYRIKKELIPRYYYPMNKFEFDRLNESPSVFIDIWLKHKIEGRKNHFSKLLKVKPNIFFKNYVEIPLMEQEGFLYMIFDEPPLMEEKVNKEVITIPEQTVDEKYHQRVRINEIMRKAEMQNEIDLHIEQLVKDYKSMSNREIIKVQLDRCRQFIDQAIMNGLHRIFIIHGLGKGKLKMEINKILEEYDEIKEYHNNFHPKYGYGATEVILE